MRYEDIEQMTETELVHEFRRLYILYVRHGVGCHARGETDLDKIRFVAAERGLTPALQVAAQEIRVEWQQQQLQLQNLKGKVTR